MKRKTTRDWSGHGVTLKAELATSGDLMLSGSLTEYPFASGGDFGQPAGWTRMSYGGTASWDKVTLATSNGIFSIYATGVATPNGTKYGAQWYYTLSSQVGKRLKIEFDSRMYPYGVQATREIQIFWYDGSTSTLVQTESERLTDGQTWIHNALLTPAVPVGATHVLIKLAAADYETFNPQANWGVQYTGMTVTVMDNVLAPMVWHDLTCDVQNMDIKYGRERFTNRYEVGQLSLRLLNEDGQYSYRDPHPLNLGPGRPVRVTAVHDGITYPLAFMIVDGLHDEVTLDGQASTVVHCLDPTSFFSAANSPSIAMDGSGSPYPLSGARVTKILDFLGYPNRLVDPGQFSTTKVSASGRTLRDELGITADSEGGAVFAERDGRVIYKDRTWLTSDPNLYEVTANLHANPDEDETGHIDSTPDRPGAPAVCLSDIATDWSQDRVINDVSLAYVGTSARHYVNKESIKQYGPKTYERMDFVLLTKAQLDARAADIMTGYAEAILRLNSVTYRPTLNPDAWPWTLKVFLNWLVRVWYTNARGDWGWRITTHIQSIEHKITPTSWETTMAVDLPTSFFATPYETGVRTVAGGATRTVQGGSERTYALVPVGNRYLNAGMGFATTGDPGLLPPVRLFILKFVGQLPATGQRTLVAQHGPSWFFSMETWLPGELHYLQYNAEATSFAQLGTSNVPMITEELPTTLAIVLDQTNPTLITSNSFKLVNGAWQPMGGEAGGLAGTGGQWDVSNPVCIGAQTEYGDSRFDGFIYSIALHSGGTPQNPGPLLWKFDANEYPDLVSRPAFYTDPRGRFWTLSNPAAIQTEVLP